MMLDEELRAVKQGNMPTHAYCTAFKRAYAKCQHADSKMDATEVIGNFVYGLNLQIYELYIKAFNADPAAVPDTIGAVMAHALDYLRQSIEVNPALSKVLDHSTKAFVAYSVDEIGDDAEVPPSSSVSSTALCPPPISPSPVLKCQLCRGKFHEARFCFKLSQPDFIRKLIEAQPPREKSKGARGGPVFETPSVTSTTASAVELDWPSDESLIICSTDVETNQCFDLEHDDHAQVSVINEASAALFDSVYSCNEILRGVVLQATADVTKRGTLKLDMGRAVVLPGATRLLIAGQELRGKYDMLAAGNEIRYTHKVSGAKIVFRCDPVRFGDHFYHCILNLSSQPMDVCASSLDFYDPPPLVPVPHALESSIWPMIHAVERFHWTTGHMGMEDMKRMCKMPSYMGEVDSAGVDLFVKHRGCSSCLIGNMRAHDQLPSSRGLSTVTGAVFQGDIFFVEADETKRLVPILLAICESSLFMYLHVFVDALARAQGKRKLMVNVSELQNALDGLLSLCSTAKHPLRELRFDRESAIAGTSTASWLQSKGVDLCLTGAGQKLGLAEVSGRIVKNRCRSTLAGILERFGYRYPAKWIPRLVADVVCILNRTARRGESLCPSQKFFRLESALDMLRDLRAPIGEILLFKKPKRGVSSLISDMKAEWGIVVSRSFNKRGVLEVYLIESKAYGHRFKFARMAVSAFVMNIVRTLSASSVPIDNEPDSSHIDDEEPFLPVGFASASDGDVGPAALEDVAPLLSPVDPCESSSTTAEFSVLSAQVSYRKALLESPDRAAPAMEREIKSLFADKKLGRPIHFRDIPVDQRKFILRSLDGYKEKYGADGEWVKSKARLFVDGSQQLPDYTAESSSPVARMESVMMLASIAAYHGWEVMKFDVVCGYPNAPRPPEVFYRYLRVSKEVAAIIVNMFPNYADFLGRDGSLKTGQNVIRYEV